MGILLTPQEIEERRLANEKWMELEQRRLANEKKLLDDDEEPLDLLDEEEVADDRRVSGSKEDSSDDHIRSKDNSSDDDTSDSEDSEADLPAADLASPAQLQSLQQFVKRYQKKDLLILSEYPLPYKAKNQEWAAQTPVSTNPDVENSNFYCGKVIQAFGKHSLLHCSICSLRKTMDDDSVGHLCDLIGTGIMSLVSVSVSHWVH
jgi:hypothetical protein